MLDKIAQYSKNLWYKALFEIECYKVKRDSDICKSSYIELCDIYQKIQMHYEGVWVKDNGSVVANYIINNINMLVDLETNSYSNPENENTFKISFRNPELLFLQLTPYPFDTDDTLDLFHTGYELSCLDLSDPVAEAMADVLVQWKGDFKKFYCYRNDKLVVMCWGLYEDEYLFTACNLDNASSIKTYIDTYDTAGVLKFIKNNTIVDTAVMV